MADSIIENVNSFYYAFVVSYLKQLSRFKALNEGKVALKKYTEAFVNKNYKDMELVQNYFDPFSILQVFNNEMLLNIIKNFRYEIMRRLRGASKGFLVGENPDDIHPKISPSNEAFFMNISEFLGVVVLVYSIEYNPCKAFSSNPNFMQISVSIGYDNNLYSSYNYQTDSAVDANPNQSNLLKSPYYMKCSDSRPIAEKIVINTDNSVEDEVTNAMIEMSQILMIYARHIPENTRKKIIDLTSTDNRFSGLRNKLQDIVTCSHQNSYYLFSCGTQHCAECLKNLKKTMNNEEIHNMKCACEMKYSSKDLNTIGIDVLTTFSR
ncbi:hypothetical protein SteCoe_31057 [Stentor coeruleus]|uniref:Uncharacterized protein n=1 Tax=Stentor coeruleus TaxID=5963 RepID=A0A1R2B259_9CILI|nr:hypothetical protein SteCoe_31057 [Stentor coeruleus]